MPKDVSTFRTEFMQEFGLSEDNDNEGTSSTAILSYISDGNDLFINYRPWTFRLKPYTRLLYEDTTVQTDFSASPAVLASTINWGSTGRFFCDYNIIEFTANDGVNTLTIENTDVTRPHLSGERCLLMYEVPSDWNRVASVKIGGIPFFKQDITEEKEPNPHRFWEIEVMQDDGVVKKYLVFPYSVSQRTVYIMYSKKATDYTVDGLDLSTTFIEIPRPYWNYLKHYVSARIYRHLEEIKTAEVHEAKAMEILRKAAIFDSRQHMGGRSPLRSEWDNPMTLLGIRSSTLRFFRR